MMTIMKKTSIGKKEIQEQWREVMNITTITTVTTVTTVTMPIIAIPISL